MSIPGVATIYADPNGKLYFCKLPSDAALSGGVVSPPDQTELKVEVTGPGGTTNPPPPPPPPPQHVTLPPFALLPVPDAETANILNPMGKPVGKLVFVSSPVKPVIPLQPGSAHPAAASPALKLPVGPPFGGGSQPVATLADAGIAELTFYVGGAFPALQYGELISNDSNLYVLEFDGKILVPDAATLASKGYQASEAIALANGVFADVPGGLSYLPVSPSTPAMVRGSVKSSDIYLYSLASSGGVQKQLLVGTQTLAYYAQQRLSSLFVPQADLDGVPLGSPAKIEIFLAKTLTISQIQCLTGAHRSGGDSVNVMFCLNDPSKFREIYAAPIGTQAASYTLVCSYGIHASDPPKAIPPTPPQGPSSPTFYGAASVAIVVDADTYPVGGNSSINTQGWLDCEQSYFDLNSMPAGEQVLNFTAMTQAFDIGPFPTGSDWEVQYQLTVQVAYAVGADGKYVQVAPTQYPNAIYGIEHFFVLMLENRSFDHLLGANKKLKPSDGAPLAVDTGPHPVGEHPQPFSPAYALSNLPYPGGTPSQRYDGGFQDALVYLDAGHEIDQVFWQIFGQAAVTADNNGQNQQILNPDGSVRTSLLPALLPPLNFKSSFIQAFCKNKNLPNPPPADSSNPLPNFDSIFECMDSTQGQAYAINALAENFQTLDRWFSSVPGPTWPNRFFLHCGTSGGISISPDNMKGNPGVTLTTGGGITLDNGTIYDRLTQLGVPWRVYHSGGAQLWVLSGMSPLWNMQQELPLLGPIVEAVLIAEENVLTPEGVAVTVDILIGAIMAVAELADFAAWGVLAPFELLREGIWLGSHIYQTFGAGDATAGAGLQRDFDNHFQNDLQNPDYVPFYTFIEPRETTTVFASTTPNLVDGVGPVNSGHPAYGLESISEDYLAKVYGYIRNSPLWGSGKCALIVMYDEHGGTYDHVTPPVDPKYNPGEQANDGYRLANDPQDGETYHLTFDFSMLGIRVPALLISPYHFCGVGASPRPNDGRIFDHASVVKTLQRRLGDTGYLTTRVRNVNDLFDSFGTTPFDPSLANSAPTQISSPAPAAPPPSAADLTQAIPTESSPNIDFSLDRAAEIIYRCNMSAEPQLLAGAVSTARAKAPGAARATALQSAMAQLLQTEQSKRAGLKTLADAATYLGSAEAALEAYRARMANASVGVTKILQSVNPKERYAAVRAAASKFQAAAGSGSAS